MLQIGIRSIGTADEGRFFLTRLLQVRDSDPRLRLNSNIHHSNSTHSLAQSIGPCSIHAICLNALCST